MLRRPLTWFLSIALLGCGAACASDDDGAPDDGANASTGGALAAPFSGAGGTATAGGAATTGSGGGPGMLGGAGGQRSGSGGGSALDAGTTTGGATTDGALPDAGEAQDCKPECQAEVGVAIGCATRFMFGVNYAWIDFGMDFGGGTRGVAANRDKVLGHLQDMKASGVSVIRWWMHPTLFAPSLQFDGSGTPIAIGGSEVADIEAALALAEQAGVYVKLTLFSFDNFRSDDRSGHDMRVIVSDAQKREALVTNVVRPIARAVAMSPHAARMASWDLINEPEWAMTGNSGRGDQDFDPMPELTSVSFSVMHDFLAAVALGVRQESAAPVTIGQAAIKWSHAFTDLDLDYYDMHYYGWVDEYFPIGEKSLSDYGIADKPVVVGEYPLQGWTNNRGTMTAEQIAQKLFDRGYAGAKAWAFTQDGDWNGNKTQLASFAADKGCLASY